MRKASCLTILMILAIMAIAGCLNIDKGGDDKDIVSETGTIKFIDLEGGFHGIIGDDGKYYNPINLSQDFQVDGLRVRFEAKIRDDILGIHMWGTPIEILKIEKLD